MAHSSVEHLAPVSFFPFLPIRYKSCPPSRPYGRYSVMCIVKSYIVTCYIYFFTYDMDIVNVSLALVKSRTQVCILFWSCGLTMANIWWITLELKPCKTQISFMLYKFSYRFLKNIFFSGNHIACILDFLVLGKNCNLVISFSWSSYRYLQFDSRVKVKYSSVPFYTTSLAAHGSIFWLLSFLNVHLVTSEPSQCSYCRKIMYLFTWMQSFVNNQIWKSILLVTL
jgi:hypothetical protein